MNDRTAALIARLSKTGDLVIGSTDDEQRARYAERVIRFEQSMSQLLETLERWSKLS